MTTTGIIADGKRTPAYMRVRIKFHQQVYGANGKIMGICSLGTTCAGAAAPARRRCHAGGWPAGDLKECIISRKNKTATFT